MNYKDTALVLVDLQKGITDNIETKPHSISDILQNATKMLQLFREKEGFIVFVKVDFLDGKDALKPNSMKSLPGGQADSKFSELADELRVKSTDYVISKRGFSAFFSTDLDLQLRRRGIKNIILGGVSTHIGVDTTARDAYQNAYNQYFISDMMSAQESSLHNFSIDHIFPYMGQVVTTNQMINVLTS